MARRPDTWRLDRRRARRWALPAALLLVALALGLAGAEVVTDAAGAREAASDREAELRLVERRFNRSHLWLEEYANGDARVGLERDVLAAQAEAAQRCAAVRDGGQTATARLAPLRDAAAQALAGRMCRRIDDFRRLTADRLENPDVRLQVPGVPERNEDLTAALVGANGDQLRRRLQTIQREQRGRMARGGGLLAVALVAFAAAALLARRARRGARPGVGAASSPPDRDLPGVGGAARSDGAADTAELEELRMIRDVLVPPAIVARAGVDVSACHVPAMDGVAGDFHLVVDAPGEQLALFVGDVAGKGLHAARRAAYIRAVLGTLAAFESSPRRLLTLANRSLMDAAGVSEFFVTAACLVVDPTTRAIRWASAGHPPPFLLDTGALLDRTPSLPLGLTVDIELTEQTLELGPGEGLLVYTDGLLEARRAGEADPDLLGTHAVARVLREQAGRTPDEVASALRRMVERHSDGRLTDDLCLVALRLGGVPRTGASDVRAPARAGRSV